ncbi:MAG: hypothetical protein D6712_13025 [Chloroflexi bacterium]|nr:MAG: hypothetical protein D6712_13025 [Chloroflexota bacterium]
MTSRTLPRYIVIFYGIALFIWLGFESDDIYTPIVFGAVMVVLIIWQIMNKLAIQTTVKPQRLFSLGAGAGAVAGASVNIFAALIMLFKDVRHGHTFPDYPLMLIVDFVARLPIWALAGGLIGLAIVLVWLAIRPTVIN